MAKKCPLLSHFPRHFYTFYLSHLGEMTKISPVVLYQWNDTMHMLCHILVKCRDLRILSHLAEMSRFTRFVAFGWNVAIYAVCRILAEMLQFTRFARHKMSAPRHLKLFCTPAMTTKVPLMQVSNLATTYGIRLRPYTKCSGRWGSGCGHLVVVAVTNCTSLPEAPCSLCGSVTLRAALTHSSLLNITFTLILIPPTLTGG